MKTPAILVNYCYDPAWLKDYPNLDVTIYDRSDDGVERNLTQYGKVIKTKNSGDVDYDKLGHLIEHYDNLPETFLWSKTNLVPRFVEKEALEKALEANVFAPLVRRDHKTYSDGMGVVCRYAGDWYEERNDSWYLNALGHRYFPTFGEWAAHFTLPNPPFIPFAPGGSYILTREKVHKFSRDFYEEMRSFLPYAVKPGEAHCAERSYGLMWK